MFRAFQRRRIIVSPLDGRLTRHNHFLTADPLYCGVIRRRRSAAWREAVYCFRLIKATYSPNVCLLQRWRQPSTDIGLAPLASAIGTAPRAQGERGASDQFHLWSCGVAGGDASYRRLYGWRYIAGFTACV